MWLARLLVNASPYMVESMVKSSAEQSLVNGEHDVSASLRTVREFVQKMGTLPGQRTLILISPGFFTMTPEAMAEKSLVSGQCGEVQRDHQRNGCSRVVHDGNSTLANVAGLRRKTWQTGQHGQYRADSMNFRRRRDVGTPRMDRRDLLSQ